MNILIFKLKLNSLAYDLLVRDEKKPTIKGKIENFRIGSIGQDSLTLLADQFRSTAQTIDAIGIHVPFGGSVFPEPVLATPDVIAKIRDLVPQSPLHLSGLIALVENCHRIFPAIPIGLTFETSFFVNLPPREYLYAINAEMTKNTDVRRFGYHGLFHEAACRMVASEQKKNGKNHPSRILSICLEPRPEVSAVIGNRPVYVTSGTTPLEGLPGQTSCGELDPNIVIELAKRKNWGPEQINEVLTRKSGLLGLVGRKTSLPRVFASSTPECRLAANIIRYRILQAAGMAAAAMGGIDVIVFSGRYHRVGKLLAKDIVDRFVSLNPANAGMQVAYCLTPLDRIVADEVTNLVLDKEFQTA